MPSNYEDNNVLNYKDKNVPSIQGQKCSQLQEYCPQVTRTEMFLNIEDKSVLIVEGQKSCPHSCEDKNVLKVARTNILNLQGQQCLQVTRTTMSLITRIKLSSSYKDRNVLIL
ncbi:unnamed protein product [Rhizophagus irregularis]|nr:unnamed protein product [Rhizophagus irregularis]